MWVLVAALALAECPEGGRAPERAAQDVLAAFAAVDDVAFSEAGGALDLALPCAAARIGPEAAAEIHRAAALRHFAAGDGAGSRRSWAAARRLEPGWLPDEVLPVGHPARPLFDEATPDEARESLGVVPPGGWWVDGAEADAVPAASAFVLQAVDADGAVAHTGHYTSPAAIPPEALRAIASLPRVPARRRTARRVGTAGSLAVGAVALGLGIASQVDIARLDTVPYDRVDATAARAVRRGNASLALGGVAAAGLAVTWAVRW